MNGLDWIAKIFDKYNRVARIYPALLALGPIIWSALALFPALIDSLAHSAVFAVAAACLLYFLSSIARSQGKYAEAKLIGIWRGWPTTILLRHRDHTIDRITKARYQRGLSAMCGGLQFPSEQEEANAPEQADDVYRSATKRLIEARRDPQYEFVHSENASYGFRRNLFGLKPVAIVIAIIAAIFTAGSWWLVTPQPHNWPSIAKSTILYPHLPMLFALDIGYLVLWLWAIRASFVFQAGREYAEALLRTLDTQN